jgi:D-amino-acid dehydrogenase
MHELLALYPLSFRYVRAGKMHLYFDQAALRTAREMVELKRSLGAVQHILSASEAQTIEPALCGSSGLTGVVYSPDDEVGDPHLFCTAMVQLLTERFGMRTIFGMTAQNLAQDQSGVAVLGTDGTRVRAKALVVALGIGAPAFLRRLGLRVSIQPLKGYSFTTAHGHAAPRISITDTVRKLVFCDLGGRMRVAGGAELGEWGLRMRPGRLERLVRAARRSLPEAADYERLDSRWAELRPMSSSSVPIIARARPGLIMNIGHGMLGWTLAMGSAERAAKLVLQELRDLSARHHVVAQPS